MRVQMLVSVCARCPSGCAQEHSQAGISRRSQNSTELLCAKSVQLFISDWEFCSMRSFLEALITFCRSKKQNNISFYMKELFQRAMPPLFPYVHFVMFLLARDFYIYSHWQDRMLRMLKKLFGRFGFTGFPFTDFEYFASPPAVKRLPVHKLPSQDVSV